MPDLVLLGGGHSHVEVLRQFGRRPVESARITLISHAVDTPYSGMLPGVVAGHYARDDAHIDLRRLSAAAGVRFLVADATGVDLQAGTVHCGQAPPVPFDLLSINIGSTPNAAVPGSLTCTTPVKPIDRFLEQWEALCARLLADGQPRRVAVVGGGAGGVELLLSVRHRLGRANDTDGRRSDRLEYHLFTSSQSLLPTHHPRVQRTFARLLAQRGVHVHLAATITRVSPGFLHTTAGTSFPVDEVLWTTEARAAEWITGTGLATDEEGFVRVAPTLQSVSHGQVFAAGDVAAVDGYRLPKSGVYAVRQGPVLARNLRRALGGKALVPYRPQTQALSLISTGDRFAIASRGAFAVQGAWVWKWKDWIDRRFVSRYQA